MSQHPWITCPSEPLPTIVVDAKDARDYRIVAIGDIHGDLDLAIRCLKLGQVIDDSGNWIAEPKTIVVQVGDQIDSCRAAPGYDCNRVRYPGDKSEDMKVMMLFRKLRSQAKAAHPKNDVISLLGNHELMNSRGDLNYATRSNLDDFDLEKDLGITQENSGLSPKEWKKLPKTGEAGRRAAFAPGGFVAKMMACERLSAVVIGSNLFVHAGLLPKLPSYIMDSGNSQDALQKLNENVRNWLLGKIDNRTEALMSGEEKSSPFWTRIYGAIPEGVSMDHPDCDNSLRKALQVYQIDTMIIGHTPQISSNSSDGINGTCYSDGFERLWRIDGGFAESFQKHIHTNHKAQVLIIENDHKYYIKSE